MSRDALAGYFAISHDLVYRLFSEGTLTIADEFHLTTIDPNLRQKLEDSSAVAGFGAIAQAMHTEARTGKSE